jgi:guanylate kinase
MKITLRSIPIIISGPSGVGKTTICDHLVRRFKNRIVYSVSATTRIARKNEKNGKDYLFLTKGEFEEWIQKGKFIEWAQVHNHFYGTPKTNFEKVLKKGYNIILDIDVQGGITIKKKYPDGLYIFLLTKNAQVLKERLKKRKTDTRESIAERLKNARKEITSISEYDYVVVNDTIKKTTETISAILIAEGCVVERNYPRIKEFKKNLR